MLSVLFLGAMNLNYILCMIQYDYGDYMRDSDDGLMCLQTSMMVARNGTTNYWLIETRKQSVFILEREHSVKDMTFDTIRLDSKVH